MNDPASLRAAAFFSSLLLCLLLEHAWPRRKTLSLKRGRWVPNAGLVLLSSALVALLPLAAFGMAIWAHTRQIGMFNQWHVPFWLAACGSFLLLDLAVYAQHRLMHRVPLLWRLHRVHHSDVEFDATTALRFHPVEILLSMLWKMAVVLALGAPAAAVLIFEIALSSFALFSHSNFDLPGDHWLRRFIVTPDMHRVHHSVHRTETDSNYGFCLSLWDRLFFSYTRQPRDGHTAMTIGLDEFRTVREQNLPALLLQPLAATTRQETK